MTETRKNEMQQGHQYCGSALINNEFQTNNNCQRLRQEENSRCALRKDEE